MKKISIITLETKIEHLSHEKFRIFTSKIEKQAYVDERNFENVTWGASSEIICMSMNKMRVNVSKNDIFS